MTPIRCPKCNRLLGYFEGKGIIACPRCRKDIRVEFDTAKKEIKIERQERHQPDGESGVLFYFLREQVKTQVQRENAETNNPKE